MRRLLPTVLALLLLLVPGAALAEEPPPPDLTAEAWLLYDATFHRHLGADDPHARRAIASTTKIMTALVVRERSSLDQPVTVSERAAGVGEAEIGLVSGETLTVYELLVAMVVDSANDAAMALAEHAGGSVEGFVELMNLEAAEMGLQDTHFANPHGLDDPRHFSSAADLLTMARRFMADPLLAELAGTRRLPFPPTPGGRERQARTTNVLLRSYPGAIGVKTGFTSDAGLTLVAAAEQEGRTVFSIVLGSEDHFADSAALLEYAFSEFGPVDVFVRGRTYARSRAAGHRSDLAATADVARFMALDDAARLVLRPALRDGRTLMVADLDGVELTSVSLEPPAAPGLPTVRQAAAWASRYWDWLWGIG